jgi:hypothetical protein
VIPWFSTLLIGVWIVASAGWVSVKYLRARATTMEACIWLIGLLLAIAPLLRSIGYIGWFMAPAWVLGPRLNWALFFLYLGLVPIRSGFILARADAVVEDFSHGALDLDAGFERWLESDRGGINLREVCASLGLRQLPLFRAAKVTLPVTRGIFRPVVILPIAWIPDEALHQRGRDLRADCEFHSHKSPADLFAAILHELAHHRGRDPHRAVLRMVCSLFLPLEWTLTDTDNNRFQQAGLGLIGRFLHSIFYLTRKPMQSLVESALRFQEVRADAGAATFHAEALNRLRKLRGDLDVDIRVHSAMSSRGSTFFCSGLVAVLGLWIAFLTPGRPLIGLAFGGDGGIRGLQPRSWSFATHRNKFNQEPMLLYRPQTRLRPAQVEVLIAEDKVPLDWEADVSQAMFLYVDAYPKEPVQGEARYKVRWEFWNFSKPSNIPMFPVTLLLRPVEHLGSKSNPKTLTFFSCNPSDFKLEDMGGGHYIASWSILIPEGHAADWFSIEWRVYNPGKVIFNAPILQKIS